MWQLNFKPAKCHVMHIGAKQGPDWKYTMQNIDLAVISEENDLGVWMNNELKFHNHVAKAVFKGKPYTWV